MVGPCALARGQKQVFVEVLEPCYRSSELALAAALLPASHHVARYTLHARTTCPRAAIVSFGSPPHLFTKIGGGVVKDVPRQGRRDRDACFALWEGFWEGGKGHRQQPSISTPNSSRR